MCDKASVIMKRLFLYSTGRSGCMAAPQRHPSDCTDGLVCSSAVFTIQSHVNCVQLTLLVAISSNYKEERMSRYGLHAWYVYNLVICFEVVRTVRVHRMSTQ